MILLQLLFVAVDVHGMEFLLLFLVFSDFPIHPHHPLLLLLAVLVYLEATHIIIT